MKSTDTKEGEFRRELAFLLPRLSRFAMALARSRADADDLLQATCERALDRAGQWSAGTRLDSWLFRIMQTVWFNELRARRVRRAHLEKMPGWEEAAEDRGGNIEQRLLVRQVEARIAALPDEQRAVLALVCVEGFTYKEAADVLSIPIGTVMSRLARARLALVEHLDADAEGPARDAAAELVSKWQT